MLILKILGTLLLLILLRGTDKIYDVFKASAKSKLLRLLITLLGQI